MSLADDLRRDEGVQPKVYRDTLGKLTIGVGRNLSDRELSEDEIEYLLRNDLARVRDELDRNAPWWRGMSQRRQDALANMAFNLGWPRLSGFKKMLGFLESGDFQFAADEALASTWAGQVGERAQRIATAFKEG